MENGSVASLLEQHYQGLLALLRRKIRDEHLAADVLNQALVTSLEHVKAGRIADPSLIAGYVFRVAMNQLRNHRRKFAERGDVRADVELDNQAAPAESGNDVHASRDLARRVQLIVNALPTERDRIIVKRYYLDEEEKDVICRDLGLSPLHFDKVIFRARQRLRALLEEKGFSKSDFFSFLVICCA